ncbi:MAG: GNAT family N-acetyltransferase [Pirellulaceae bacterium]|nr:GNAT family N-acetyltransferase [Pirellulaceae bacterium]
MRSVAVSRCRWPARSGDRLSSRSFALGPRPGTEAASRMLQHGWQTLQLPRIVAIIDPSNLASIRVAEKLGMHFEKEVTFKNYDHPDHLYVREWSAT